MRTRNHRRYDASFKASTIALLERSDRSLLGIAKDLGIPIATLRYWYDAEMAKKKRKGPAVVGDAAPAEAETLKQRVTRLEKENEQLRKKNAELEEDRVILKKAAAFFAKESE